MAFSHMEIVIETIFALVLLPVLTARTAAVASDPNASASAVALVGLIDFVYVALILFGLYRHFKKAS